MNVDEFDITRDAPCRVQSKKSNSSTFINLKPYTKIYDKHQFHTGRVPRHI
jgi:hypothetical protein